MATLDDLRHVFESFCSFGSNRNLAGNLGSTDSLFVGPTMDGAKFAKFARDSKIVDNKKITSTDIDILFNKAKAKGARRLDWDSFLVAFQELAEKKYPKKNPSEAFNSLLNDVAFKSKGPKTNSTVAQADGVFDKLTNTQLYTGTHKHRFDDDGRGRGMEGRDTPSKTNQLESFINRDVATTITGAPVSVSATTSGLSAAGGSNSVGAAKKRGQAAVVTASTEKLGTYLLSDENLVAHKPKDSKLGSTTSLNKSASNSMSSLNRNTSKSQGSIGNLNKKTSGVSVMMDTAKTLSSTASQTQPDTLAPTVTDSMMLAMAADSLAGIPRLKGTLQEPTAVET
ncbi:hypothetical protein HK102_000315 [Quaeritorhiza haematococci]|nr:hypothetical protein HK102_000315 [Quaeritorhiza haematococci]